MSVPDVIPIAHDSDHARHVGRLADGRLFFVTRPFVPRSSASPGCEYVAVFLFTSSGAFVEARIDTLGPRGEIDDVRASELLNRRLAELGPMSIESIAVAPFCLEHEGVTFGLVARPPQDEGDDWWVVLEPGDYMAFTAPWRGAYDT